MQAGLNRRSHPQSALLSARRGSATLEELFAAAYLRYCRYIDPQTREVSNLFTVLQWLQLHVGICNSVMVIYGRQA